jgi:uncharacterized protein (DUF486 family)
MNTLPLAAPVNWGIALFEYLCRCLPTASPMSTAKPWRS